MFSNLNYVYNDIFSHASGNYEYYSNMNINNYITNKTISCAFPLQD